MSRSLSDIAISSQTRESVLEIATSKSPVFAIHHQSDGATVTVIFIAGRPQTRVGPHRLFVYLARQFAQARIDSIRFDHTGWGDSLGSANDYQQPSEELTAIIGWHKQQQPNNRIVLLGLCDGATASLLAEHGEISGLILLNPFFDNDAAWSGALMQDHYLSQTKSPKALMAHIKQPLKIPSKMLEFWRHWRQSNTTPATISANNAIEKLQSSKLPTLLCWSENDLTATQSQLQLKDWLNKPQQTVKLTTVQDADHTFSSSGSRNQLFTLASEFVNTQILTIKK